MYSHIKNVQILVALLKEFNIRDVVLAPGGSDIPLIYSIENDNFFECYSIIDERSLVYFAMGISQQKNVPVVCLCTSGTAVCNFLPGMTEAYYQDVPIVAITADKHPYRQGQLETQKIDQTEIFKGICRKSVNLPMVNTSEEEWYCGRLVNEALLELNHHGRGPVHINIPVLGKISVFNADELPKVKKITRIDATASNGVWLERAETLSRAERVLLVIGQNISFSDVDIKNIKVLFKKINCAISIEHLSNLNCTGALITYPLTDARDNNILDKLMPDLVISLGNNVASAGIKPFIRRGAASCCHWTVDESGRVRDMFDCLTTVFECPASIFFEKMAVLCAGSNNMEYYSLWANSLNAIPEYEVPYSDFYAVRKLTPLIPEHSILHMAILNSTRLFQFNKLAPNVKVYCNVGALGIDGCLSTFLGQASATEELSVCVLGDLSYFYDMNATSIRHVGKNVRILLLNNAGAAEFHYLVGNKNIPTLNNFISAKNNRSAMGWVESLGYRYMTASTKEELDKLLPEFVKPSDKPVFFELFTDMEIDAEVVLDYYRNVRTAVGGTKSAIVGKAKSMLSDEMKFNVKKMLGRLKK